MAFGPACGQGQARRSSRVEGPKDGKDCLPEPVKKFGLPKSHLLRTSKEFNRVYRCGKRFYGSGFVVISLASGQPFGRLGVSVSRKVGNAVRRNRIKRLIREVFRLHNRLFPLNSDVVFAVRPDFSLVGMHALRTAIAELPWNTGQN